MDGVLAPRASATLVIPAPAAVEVIGVGSAGEVEPSLVSSRRGQVFP